MVGSEIEISSQGFKLYHHKAPEKKHPQTVLFVHHMWGNHKTPWRHYRLLNELGYDCVTFDLIVGSNIKLNNLHPFIRFAYKGIFYVWKKQIESILNDMEGEKILFAFSGPSYATLWAALGRNDIKKVICDGGPFKKLYSNTRNFFYHEAGITKPLPNKIITYLGTSLWGYRPSKKLYKILSQWNTKVPILSIRGLADNIVDIDSIRDVFNPHKQLSVTVVELKEGKHLDGLREYPEEYSKAVKDFLLD